MAQVTFDTGRETYERRELRAQFRRLLAKSWGDEHVRQYADGERDCGRELAAALHKDMALHALTIPVDQGGLGGGCVEAAIAAEELGAAMAPSRLLATTMVSHLVTAGRGTGLEALLPQVADGLSGTLLWPGDDATWDVRQIASASVTGHGAVGTFRFVADLDDSNLVLCPARNGNDYGVVVADPAVHLNNSEIRPLRVLDVFRPIATVSMSVDDAQWLAVPDSNRLFTEALAAGAIVLASEMIGAARACLERMAVYAQQRHQFGRPIGTFQALKHRIVDVLVSLEASRALTYKAAKRFDDDIAQHTDIDDCIAAARMAKASASDTLRRASKECLQVHGGIGFTWENPVHFYLKRWASSARLLGSPDQLRTLVYRNAIKGIDGDVDMVSADRFDQLSELSLEQLVEEPQ